ncbi:unnamed protein product [Paramecium sonneborni]|uniref:Transmembrane protein n=1 Tax=Paramecium sonneborni TaxID=65129 RepID=A0A8S1MWJ9_9CILI|nr:unnamed protein product [Paramecium sonneborni]
MYLQNILEIMIMIIIMRNNYRLAAISALISYSLNLYLVSMQSKFTQLEVIVLRSRNYNNGQKEMALLDSQYIFKFYDKIATTKYLKYQERLQLCLKVNRLIQSHRINTQ